MSDPARPTRQTGASDLSLTTLVYRYFFFGWLFRDASRGSFLERAAALQFNREQSAYLPLYLWRWLVLVVVSYALGALVESSFTAGLAAALCYGFTTVSLAVMATAARSWLLLRYG